MMMNFIYFCMAFLIISFIGVPIYNGISNEHDKLAALININEVPSDDSLSFEEIYALADQSSSDNPAFLNDIMPAAGIGIKSDTFSNGFRAQEDSALEETPPMPIIEEEAL